MSRTSIALNCLIGAALAMTSCGSPPVPAAATPPPGLIGEAVMSPGSTPAPNFALQDQNDQATSLSQFHGRVVALTFLYSHCVNACPLIGEQLGQAQKALGPKAPFVIVVVSVQPSTDTPDSVQAFAATHHWTGEWHWLLGPGAKLPSVWKDYGVDVQPVQNGNLPHSIVLYILDRSGFERAGLLFTDPARIEQDVRILAAS